MDKRNLNQKKTEEIRVGLYIRVSTEEQALNPEGSIKNQEERLLQAVKLKQLEGQNVEVFKTYIDRAKSGKDTKRPKLQEMLQDIRDQKLDIVMSSELSRISRNMKDFFSEIWELMKFNECGFQSLRENFDTTTAAGEMVLYTIANIAQFERRQVSERVSANINERSRRGLYNGGSVPVGYKLIEGKPGFDEGAVCEPASLKSFDVFREKLGLIFLNGNGVKADTKLQAKVIEKLVHKVEVGTDSVRVHYFVGKDDIERESANLASSQGFFMSNSSNSLTNGALGET